jgi:hypothetical protein
MPWFWAFLFTQVVEVPIYMRGIRARFHEALGASSLTHPIVWFVIPELMDWFYLTILERHASIWLTSSTRYGIMVFVAEVFAVVAEALYFRFIGSRKTLALVFDCEHGQFWTGFVVTCLVRSSVTRQRAELIHRLGRAVIVRARACTRNAMGCASF